MAEQQPDNNNLISCRVCGVIMVKIAKDICPKCFKEEEELFAKIKNFLRANPGASITQVAEYCGCTEDAVHAFIKSGRLERVGLRRIAHQCELCNATIYEGVMCAECRKKLKDQVKQLRSLSPQQN